MREWQQTRYPKFVLPDAVYHQSLWAVRDLARMEKRLSELEAEAEARSRSIVESSGKRTHVIVRPVESHAVERLILEERIHGIYRALETVPKQHRIFILNNITLNSSGKDYPYEMWKYWKQEFLYHVAKNLSMI